MKILYRYLFAIANMITLILSSGCAAVQWAMPIDQSLQGMRAAVTGQVGTWVYSNPLQPDKFILGWSTGQRYAFALVDQGQIAMQDIRDFCALKCDWRTAADFLKWAEANGWECVPAATLPPALYSQVGTLAYLISIGSRTLPSILVIPFVIPDDPMQLINPQVRG